MKVRFYCDIPSQGVRIAGPNSWPLVAWSDPTAAVIAGFTRVAFDVDMPPHLVWPRHDEMAPPATGVVVDGGQSGKLAVPQPIRTPEDVAAIFKAAGE